eukprot:Ihof_evm2s396 gene=Ihof_evmTU2s396
MASTKENTRRGGRVQKGSPVDPRLPIPPNESEYNTQKAGIDKDLKDLQSQLKALTMNNNESTSSKASPISNKLTQELRDLRASKSSCHRRKDTLATQLRAAQDNLKTKMDKSKALYAQPRGPRVENYDEEISKIEEAMKEEGANVEKLTVSLTKLQTGRALNEQIKAASKEIEETKAVIKKYKEEQMALGGEIGEIKKREDAIKPELEAIRASQNAESEAARTVMEQRDDLRKKIDACYDKKRTIQAAYLKAQAQYWEKVKTVKMAIEEEEKEKSIRLAADQVAKKKERAIELASIDPFEEQKVIIVMLTSYLKSIQRTLDDTNMPEVSKKSLDLKEGVKEGEKMIGKKCNILQEGIFIDHQKNNQNKKKKGGRNANKETLTYPVSVLSDFASLRVSPPLIKSDIPATLTALEERKNFYEEQRQKRAEALITTETENKPL